MSDIYYQQLLETIKTYLLDSQFTRALLIDGDWGCGKSYFVKNTLIHNLEATPINKDNADKTYNVILVSLFGMSAVKEISEAILKKRIIKDPENADTKEKNFFEDIKQSLPEMIKGFSDNPFYQTLSPLASKVLMPDKDDTILIFDDFERSSIDTLELMGFINNLCENDGYRTIIIANEKEVKEHDSSSDKGEDQVDVQYKRTREKLIGHTIRLEPKIAELYDVILEDVVKGNERTQDLLSKKKNIICDCFRNNDHHNLRTLISVFKCAETITTAIDSQIDLPDFGILSKEEIIETVDAAQESLLNYIATSAIKRSTGYDATKYENQYNLVPPNIPNITAASNKCVDEYWKSLMIDSQLVTAQFKKDVEQRLTLCAKTKEDINHKNLALFQLKAWTTLTDEELNKNLSLLKEELKAKKYYVQEYGDIIFVLMCIADMNTGLITNDMEDFKVPDSWPQINPREYVEQMDLTDVKGDTLTIEMLDPRTYDDSSSAFINEFNRIAETLIQEIVLNESRNNLRRNPFDNYGEKLKEIFNENANYYISSKRFLSLYEHSEIEKVLLSKDVSRINALSDVIAITYLNEDGYYYAGMDIDILYNLHSDLAEDRKNGRPKYNKSLLRTLEIALCAVELCADRAFQYQNELVEAANPFNMLKTE